MAEQMKKEHALDQRRDIVFPGDHDQTLQYAVNHWVQCANDAIEDHGFFVVALSGGSTPKKIFQALASDQYRQKVDWKKVFLFWSDERAVSPENSDSNYHMAMVEGELATLGIEEKNIFRMHAEENIEANAEIYEQHIQEIVPNCSFDLIMLGMGDDGHTASLFPHTKALEETKKLVIANWVAQKDCWRMSFTYHCINQAKEICLYVLGEGKSQILPQVLATPLNFQLYPSQNIGTAEHKALWIVDNQAGQNLQNALK